MEKLRLRPLCARNLRPEQEGEVKRTLTGMLCLRIQDLRGKEKKTAEDNKL